MILYDTSMVFDELRKGKPLSGYVLDLTIYEFLNVVWKYVKLLKKLTEEEAITLLQSFLDQDLKIIRVQPEDAEEIMDIAVRDNLTAYDASYVYYAVKLDLKLETLD